MKLLNRLLIGALSCAAATTVTAQDSTSEQALGFVRIELERGTQTIVSLPFDSFDGEAQTAADLIGDTLPPNTALIYWDTATQSFVTERYQKPGLSSPVQWTVGIGQTEKAFSRGEAFFLTIPANAPEASYTLVLTGIVPDGPDSDTEVPLTEGLVLMGVPYPIETDIDEANLNLLPADNESVNLWVNGNWQRKGYNRPDLSSSPAWENTSVTIKPGQGFFYRVQNDRPWQLTRSALYASPLAPSAP